MKLRVIAPAVLMMTVLGFGCGGASEQAEEADGSAPQTPEQAQQQQADQTQALARLDGRLTEIGTEVSEVRASAERAGVAAAAEIETRMSDLERRMQQAKSAAAQRQAEELEGHVTGLEAELARTRDEIAAVRAAMRQESIAALKPYLDKQIVVGLDGVKYLAYSKDFVGKVQERLQALGYYDGPADGWLEPTTQNALGKFQEDQETWPSGVPTPVTRDLLFGEGA